MVGTTAISTITFDNRQSGGFGTSHDYQLLTKAIAPIQRKDVRLQALRPVKEDMN